MEGVGVVEPEGVVPTPEKAPEVALNMNKENEDVDADGASQDPPKSGGLGSSAVRPGERNSATASRRVPSSTKSPKTVKDRGGRNVELAIPRNQKVSLSKSLTFPAKAAPPTSLRKSTIFVKQKKTDEKNPGQNGSKAQPTASNGGLAAKQTNLVALSSTRQSSQLKAGSAEAANFNGTSEAAQSNDDIKKPLREILSAKNDDDANSATSSTSSRTLALRKSTGPGFAFRLDERAEKRKEFFMKIEEKIHAKEVEKTNLQEKSKEDQEAEIKQLRKSLTFKATPMPSFYQEPGPPKVELKKIPPTRARSPKLGRHKPSASTAENSYEGSISSRSSRPGLEAGKSNGGVTNGKVDSVASKKPTQKPLSRLPSQKSTAVKPEAKSTGLKPKNSTPKQKIDKAAAVKSSEVIEDSPETVTNAGMVTIDNPADVPDSLNNSIEAPDGLGNPGETPDEGPEAEMISLENVIADDATITNLCDSEIASNEVVVEG